MLLIEQISKRYQAGSGGAVLALDGIDLVVERGEFVAIIGPSGCGKSTLLEIVGGLTHASSGRVVLDNEEVRAPHPAIGVVFQEDSTLPWRTVAANVEFGLQMRGVPARERQARAQAMINLVGLAGFERHYPAELSGGMRQRVAIARTLVMNPEVILMDEPFGALDEQTRLILGEELLGIWKQTGATILFVTHSIDEAALLADRIVVMSARPGRVKGVVVNPLPRPRDSEVIGDPRFGELTGRLWHTLRAEVVRLSRPLAPVQA